MSPLVHDDIKSKLKSFSRKCLDKNFSVKLQFYGIYTLRHIRVVIETDFNQQELRSQRAFGFSHHLHPHQPCCVCAKAGPPFAIQAADLNSFQGPGGTSCSHGQFPRSASLPSQTSRRPELRLSPKHWDATSAFLIVTAVLCRSNRPKLI